MALSAVQLNGAESLWWWQFSVRDMVNIFPHLRPRRWYLFPDHWASLTGLTGTLLLSLPSKAKSRHSSSQNISAKQHCPSPLSVCTVCVCMHVHVCVCVCIFCIVTLEPLTTLFGSFFIIFFLYTFLLLITFPSQCTLCVLYYAC